MTNAMGGRQNIAPEPPRGWPIGSYRTYAEAQRAVDYLSDNRFPVQDVTIVGVDLMQVEKVLGRLTWGRVIATGLASGAWLGLFIGLMFSLFTAHLGVALIYGVIAGLIFGLISAAIPYAATRGTRDFSSAMTLVAGRYDVLCDPRTAEQGKSQLGNIPQR